MESRFGPPIRKGARTDSDRARSTCSVAKNVLALLGREGGQSDSDSVDQSSDE
jgi:hypothetical protein